MKKKKLNGFLSQMVTGDVLLFKSLSTYEINTLQHGKCFRNAKMHTCDFIHSLIHIRKLTRLLRTLVRFLILLNS